MGLPDFMMSSQLIAGAAIVVAGLAVAGGMRLRTPPLTADSTFSAAAKSAVSGKGFLFSTTQVTVDPGSLAGSNGVQVIADRVSFAGGASAFEGSTWDVHQSNLAAHFDIQREDLDAGVGGGLFLDTGNSHSIVVLVRPTASPTLAVLASDGQAAPKYLLPPRPAPALHDGVNSVDVVVAGGNMRVIVNDSVVTNVPLPASPTGRFGLFVAPHERYSFGNVLVAALSRY